MLVQHKKKDWVSIYRSSFWRKIIFTTVIKYELMIRNWLWRTGAVTQESLQNSSVGKIFVSYGVKDERKYCSFFWGAFVLSAASELIKNSKYVVHNHIIKYVWIHTRIVMNIVKYIHRKEGWTSKNSVR